MNKSVLITLGRLPKALDLARSFKQLGYRVIVAEPFRWHVTGASNSVDKTVQVTAPNVDRDAYLNELLNIVVREKVSLIVPVSEEIIHVSFLREKLDAHNALENEVTLYAMPSATLLRLHNKYQFIDCCKEYGVLAPETHRLTDSTAALSLNDKFDTVIKPIFSCSGRGVVFRKQGEALPTAEIKNPQILQAQIVGQVLSTFSIAHEGRALTTVVYRGLVMSGTVAVAFERVDETDTQYQRDYRAVIAWVNQFISAAKFSGFISFDLIVNSEGIAYGIECNPRATSGLHFVDPRDLASAVVNPDAATNIRFVKARQLQQFYPCLTETQKSMFGPKFFANLATLRRTREVTWSWRDAWPFLSMPFTASQIIYLAIKSGATFGEVATLDVGWYEDLGARSK